MHVGSFAHIGIIRRFKHPEIRQPSKATTEDPNKLSYGDIFRLMGSATSTVAQRHQEQALSRLWLIWPQLEMGRKFLTDQLPPSDPTFGTDRIQPARIRIEQLKIVEPLMKGELTRFLNC
jgi:hypothetical protein